MLTGASPSPLLGLLALGLAVYYFNVRSFLLVPSILIETYGRVLNGVCSGVSNFVHGIGDPILDVRRSILLSY